MKSTQDQIEDIKNNGYTLDFSNVFNHAFENYKKIALYAGLIILVFSIIFGAVAVGLIGAYYGAQSLSKDFLANLENQQHTYEQLVVLTIGVSLFTALVSPFSAGFLKMADCADKDEEFNVSTIFSYYKAPYFSQLFISAFIIAIIGTAISNFLQSIGINFLGLIITIIISFFTYLTIPLIVFGNLKALDAIKSSSIIILKNPLMILAFIIVGTIGTALGFFACCIGIIFTIAFNTSMTYAVYCSIFDMEKEDPIDTIGRSDFE